jgi:hypothetical protein
LTQSIAARLPAVIAIGGIVIAATLGGSSPARGAEPDLCAKAGAVWSKGIVTQYPWKVISSKNNFEVKYCIVRETATNRDEAFVRFTNTSAKPLWLKVRTFYGLSSGRRIETSTAVAQVKPQQFAAQSLPHSQTKPGEQIKELGFHEMVVSEKQLR